MKLSREQFQTLAMQQLGMLYRLARRLASTPEAAEDLVQETYLRAVRAQARFDLQDFGIGPWLVRIMHNLHSSRAVREQRQPRSMDSEGLDGASARTAERSANFPPINLSSFDAMDQRLVGALESLPKEYQSVLLLWAVEGFSYREIADSLNVPMGTVMSRLYRARERISDRLRNKSGE